MRATRWPALALALLSAPAFAAPLPETAEEPLPAGALARFGAAPLRHRGPAPTVAFSPHRKTLATPRGRRLIPRSDARRGRPGSALPRPGDPWETPAPLPR